MSARESTSDVSLLTVAETAKRLHVSPVTVYRQISAGELPAVRIGKALRVDPGELEAWLYSPAAVFPPFQPHHRDGAQGGPGSRVGPPERTEGEAA